MGKFIAGFLLGAFLALVFQPYMFPDGFADAIRHMFGG
jgi:hypothetical protein